MDKGPKMLLSAWFKKAQKDVAPFCSASSGPPYSIFGIVLLI